jgi:hypothetical protein
MPVSGPLLSSRRGSTAIASSMMSRVQRRSISSRPSSSRSATERPPDLKMLLHPKQGVAFYSTATEILCGSADRECRARYQPIVYQSSTLRDL